MIPLSWYLIVAAVLFSVGMFGAISRKNAIAILISIELMLNAVNINILAFWHYHSQTLGYTDLHGMVFAAIVIMAAAAEVAVGLALIIAVYRQRKTVVASEVNVLKG
ncbi:MAG: NADH-quinone oxidoreductase subunit NuoK [Anaerolineaceae bacterium]|nr:NADH-quinone oxidoreductase subunit NuoK [Anaerolineaceae bacterium]